MIKFTIVYLLFSKTKGLLLEDIIIIFNNEKVYDFEHDITLTNIKHRVEEETIDRREKD